MKPTLQSHAVELALVVCLAATAFVFSPGLDGEFTWDDNGLIRTNEKIQQPRFYKEALTSHFWNISAESAEVNETYDHLYRPVVTLAYIVQYRLFQLNANGYRAVSFTLHLLCCLLAFIWLLRRITPRAEGFAVFVIAIAGSIFAMHPSRAEVVSWISGSTELWMTLFILGGWLAYSKERRWLSGLLLAFALLSKETAIVAGPLFLIDRFLTRDEFRPKDAVPLLLPVAGALALRTAAIGMYVQAGESHSPVARVVSTLGFFVRDALMPWNPTVFPGFRSYSCGAGETFSSEALLLGGVTIASLILLVGLAVYRKAWRPALSDALWFIVPLLPVMNLVDLGSRNLIADRFLYLPLLGGVGLLAHALLWLASRSRVLGLVSAGATALLALAFAVVTYLYVPVFTSSSTLWEYEVKSNPDNPFALHAVGIARVQADLFASGQHFLERAWVVSKRTCVHGDQLRAAKDLAWCMAWTHGAKDREALESLDRAYDRLLETGRFTVSGTPGFDVVFRPHEVEPFVTSEMPYVHPRALVKARLGRVDEATALLEGLRARTGRLKARSTSLLAELRASNGDLAAAASLANEDDLRADAKLQTELAVLQQVGLERPRPVVAAISRHALGFGDAPLSDSQRPIGSEPAALVEALHRYNVFEPVPPSLLAGIAQEGNAADRLLQLVRSRTAIQELDQQLLLELR